MEKNLGVEFLKVTLKNMIRSIINFVMHRKLQIIGSLALMAVAISACSTTGYVLEEGTNKPIEGAYVVMEWNGTVFTPAGGTSVRYGVDVARTDKDGKYWFSDFRFSALRGTGAAQSVYKSGFHLYVPKAFDPTRIKSDPNTLLLAPHSGTQEEKFKQIGVGFLSNCDPESNPNKILPVLKAIYEEKRANAETAQQKYEVQERWLGAAEYCEFGSEVASQNRKLREELRWKNAIKENSK